MEFPHLNDTSFPLLDNVNVYSYKNDFDYTRWPVATKVTLTNVLWDSDYGDVVKFESNEERDAWFDSNESAYVHHLKSATALPPEGGIKLPIPFDVASRYNYLYVDIPIMTSADAPIEYEDESLGIRRWYFFVNEVSSRAPNTTMFVLSLDVWTQFHNDLSFNYLFLERGHAPVAATDTDTYLANPIANNDYLLTPDVTPTVSGIARSQKFIPFGNGKKYVCIASTCEPNQLANVGATTTDSSYSDGGSISYSDDTPRYGYQTIVNGWGAGNGQDWSNLKAPASVTNGAHARIANNTFCYCVEASEIYNGTFFEDVMSQSPSFMSTILGCFVVDESMLLFGNPYTFCGHTMRVAHGSDKEEEIPALTKSDFGYPSRYERFAKLYTYPYASIELCDNEGEKVTVRIENTGTVKVHKVAALAFPYVRTRVYFTGIGGVGSASYTWKSLQDTDVSCTIPTSDWFDYCFDHEIPCFALYMDGQSAWYLNNFNRAVKGARNNALVAYHNATRAANTARANAVDSNNTMYSNADADATTLTTNTANSVNTNRANADITIASNTAKTNLANTTSNLVNSENANKARAITNAGNLATTTTAVAENESTSSVAFNSGFGGVAGQVMSAGTAGMLYGAAAGSAVPGAGNVAGAAAGMAIGAMVGVVSAGVSWGTSDANASAVMQANSATAAASIAANTASLNGTLACNSGTTTLLNGQRTYDNNQNNDVLDRHTTNTGNNMNTNAANTAATMRANANRTRNTGNANAGYTREVAIINAKETLENARNSVRYELDDAAMGNPVAVGAYAGDATSDYMRTRGIQWRVRTMPDAEVRQCGDWFARYGYALDQIWDVAESGLVPMNHFCYWKCRDAWIDDRQSSNNMAQAIVTAMFERGVTVWKDPDEVGRVSIYDN